MLADPLMQRALLVGAAGRPRRTRDRHVPGPAAARPAGRRHRPRGAHRRRRGLARRRGRWADARRDALAVPGAWSPRCVGAVGSSCVRASAGGPAATWPWRCCSTAASPAACCSSRSRAAPAPTWWATSSAPSRPSRRATWCSPSGSPALVLVVGLGLRAALFAVSHDEEFARAAGPARPGAQHRGRRRRGPDRHRRDARGRAAARQRADDRAGGRRAARRLGRSAHHGRRDGVGVVVCVAGLTITYWYDAAARRDHRRARHRVYAVTPLVQTRPRGAAARAARPAPRPRRRRPS